MTARRIGALLCCAVPVAWALLAPEAARGAARPQVRSVKLEGSPDRVVMREDGAVHLEVKPLPGEGYQRLAERTTGNAAIWRQIHRANGGPPRLDARKRYRVALELLSRELQVRALKALWPKARYDGREWVHVVSADRPFGRPESLWAISQWLTGEGGRWKAIRKASGKRSRNVHPGEKVRVPAAMLRPGYRIPAPFPPPPGAPAPEAPAPEAAAAPPAGTGAPPARSTASTHVDGELEYGEDDRGRYAVYRLRAGEALYSSVVIRFTGRVDADEVNSTAALVARRSGIRDVTDIPVGFPVKIPLELLTPEYLPGDDPRRIAYEAGLREAAGLAAERGRAANLRGVVVILDAGHGGVDPGASNGRVWEDDYAYDIMVRVKEVLERKTSATVHATIRDQSQGFRPHNGRFKSRDTDEVLLTTPHFHHKSSGQTAVAVNLRWYLSNSLYRQAKARGVSSDRVVFVSFHADSLHPSLRGAMVYVPGREYRPRSYGKSGEPYRRYKEFREQPEVRFSGRDLTRSEGLSRALAKELVGDLRSSRIMIHPHKPVRDHVVRGGRAWVPAVLRYNQVPTSVLVEVCNLNNRTDQKRIADPDFRQLFAEAFVRGLESHFE
jgi:N-acetylmuramoyl-L-alanine amidase